MFSFFEKLNQKEKKLLITCFYAFFCNGTLALMIGSAMPDIAAAYGLSETVKGLLISSHSVGNWAASLLYGIMVLAMGQKKSVILMDILALVGFAMVFVWGNPIFLVVAFVFLGMGRGSVTTFNNSTVNRLSGGSPIASNFLHASFAVGAILTPMVFLVLSRAFSWQVGMGFSAACILVCVLFLFRVKIEEGTSGGKKGADRSLEFIKNPSFIILAIMMFSYICAEYSINGWLVTYIQEKQELRTAFADEAAVKSYSQTMATLLWAIILVGRLACAYISTKVSQKKLIMFSSFGVAGFFALMLMSASIPLVTVAVAGLGLCMAGICPMIYSDAAVFTNRYALGTSILLFIGFLGGILMPTVVGALADIFGFAGGMSAILVAVVVLAVLSVLNAVLPVRMPENT